MIDYTRFREMSNNQYSRYKEMQRKNHDTANVQDEVVPFYFGTSPQRLYGCYHQPQVSSGKAIAVVLCAPIGQEYIQSHRVIYQLAVLLSRAGFPVLRFDYYGCGDSEGIFEQGSIGQWIKDIHAAVKEIRDRSRQTNVYLIGLRMGATLALRAAEENHHVIGIILWDPILRGNRYLRELIEGQCDFVKHYPNKISNTINAEAETPDEILGYPMTSNMWRELGEIIVHKLLLPPSVRLLAVSNSEDPHYVSDLNQITDKQLQGEMRVIPDQTKVWKEFYKKLTPHKTLLNIVKWIDSL